MKSTFIFESERLGFRRLERSDLDDLFELDSNPAVHRYLGNSPVASREQSLTYLENILSQYEANDIGRFALIEKASGEFIGWSGLKLENKIRPEPYYDIGYRLKEKFWGKGFATESAVASLDYGFNTLQLPKICAGAHVDNIASNKILQKIGLKFIEVFDFEGMPINWYEMERPSTD